MSSFSASSALSVPGTGHLSVNVLGWGYALGELSAELRFYGTAAAQYQFRRASRTRSEKQGPAASYAETRCPSESAEALVGARLSRSKMRDVRYQGRGHAGLRVKTRIKSRFLEYGIGTNHIDENNFGSTPVFRPYWPATRV